MFYMVGAVLIICAVIAYNKRKSDRARQKASDSFWEKEREANMTRRKDISKLPYITIPYESLPIDELPESEEYSATVRQLQSLSDKRILDLSGQSNTDLKLTYGAANLPVLMECDQNYLVLIRTLSRMAALLTDAGKDDAAEVVLRFALDTGSTIRSDYEQLAVIYSQRRDYHKLDALIARAEALDTPTKITLLASLNAIKGQTVGTQNPDFDIDTLFLSDDAKGNHDVSKAESFSEAIPHSSTDKSE